MVKKGVDPNLKPRKKELPEELEISRARDEALTKEAQASYKEALLLEKEEEARRQAEAGESS